MEAVAGVFHGLAGLQGLSGGPGAANELFAMTARMTGAGLGEAQDSVRLLARTAPSSGGGTEDMEGAWREAQARLQGMGQSPAPPQMGRGRY